MEHTSFDQLNRALGPRYRVVREIGRGGMAVVLEAVDERHHRPVAIKVISPEHAASAGTERFLREIQVLASLQHRGIVPLFDSGIADGMPFLVMPLIRGSSLRQRLDHEKQLSLTDALRIATELAEALDYAHRRGIVHRDIKPANVLLEDGHASLSDFGIAAALGESGGTRLTQTGVSVGTPLYMSPEQATGGVVDARSDIYSLGCVLHEMLGGEPPFTGPTAEVVIRQHLSVEPRSVTTLRPNTPEHVARAILRALAKPPGDRFQTAAEFGAALHAMGSESVQAEAPTTTFARPAVLGAWGARIRHALLLATVLGLAAWGAWTGYRRLGGHADQNSAVGRAKKAVLVAEFESSSPDPSLGVAARQLVMASLDQSDRLESVSFEQVKGALALAGKPDSTRIDGALARELAFRSGIKLIVEGRIDQVGDAVSITLTARDAEDEHVVSSVTGYSRASSDLLATLGELSRRIRRELGEKSTILEPSGPRWIAATPSFEAYRKYAAAFEMQQMRGDDLGSIALLNEVLQLDPDFAEAWALKMFAHGHLGQSDSSRFAMNEALKHPQRLTEEGRMFLEGLRDAEDGNFDLAAAKYQELIRRGYQLSSSLGNYGSILWDAGRYEEALEQYQRAVHASPFGPQQWVLDSEVGLLLMFGRVAEARQEIGGLRGHYADEQRLALEVVAEEWDRAESLAVAYEQDPTRGPRERRNALRVRAGLQSSRGALREARSLFAAIPASLPSLEVALRSSGLHLDSMVRAARLPDDPLLRGLDAASRGDRAGARSALAALRAQNASPGQVLPVDVAVLEACVAGAEGHWPEAAARLGPLADPGERPGRRMSPPLVRWLAADAHDRANHPDSAAVFFENCLKPDGLYWAHRMEVKSLSPYARVRLARLYLRMGRTAAAREQGVAARALLQRPDPEVRQLLAGLETTLATAGGSSNPPAR